MDHSQASSNDTIGGTKLRSAKVLVINQFKYFNQSLRPSPDSEVFQTYRVTQNKVHHLLAILYLIFEVNISQVSNSTDWSRLPDWHRLVPTSTDWSRLSPTGPDQHLLVPTNTDWPRLAPTGPDQHRLVPTSTDWSGLAPTGPDQHQLVPPNTHWS